MRQHLHAVDQIHRLVGQGQRGQRALYHVQAAMLGQPQHAAGQIESDRRAGHARGFGQQETGAAACFQNVEPGAVSAHQLQLQVVDEAVIATVAFAFVGGGEAIVVLLRRAEIVHGWDQA
jgi:hypothetical protein